MDSFPISHQSALLRHFGLSGRRRLLGLARLVAHIHARHSQPDSNSQAPAVPRFSCSKSRSLRQQIGRRDGTLIHCVLHSLYRIASNPTTLSTTDDYCSRYHFYYLPKREQSYQLLQMTIGMCVDLGLTLRPEEAVVRKVGLRLSHYRKADQASGEHDAFYTREARRGYLGCYYLSTNTAWISGKPCNIHV